MGQGKVFEKHPCNIVAFISDMQRKVVLCCFFVLDFDQLYFERQATKKRMIKRVASYFELFDRVGSSFL